MIQVCIQPVHRNVDAEWTEAEEDALEARLRHLRSLGFEEFEVADIEGNAGRVPSIADLAAYSEWLYDGADYDEDLVKVKALWIEYKAAHLRVDELDLYWRDVACYYADELSDLHEALEWDRVEESCGDYARFVDLEKIVEERRLNGDYCIVEGDGIWVAFLNTGGRCG